MDTWYSVAYKTIATREDVLPSTNKDELGTSSIHTDYYIQVCHSNTEQKSL